MLRQYVPKLVAGTMCCGLALNANAALTSYAGPDGAGLVYSSLSDVTWTQDANLFETMLSSNPNLISDVIAVTPAYEATVWGPHTNTVRDFIPIDVPSSDRGLMTWWGANAWANYLNSIRYGGINEWRLPTQSWPPLSAATTGEFGQLFYGELGGTAGNPIPDTDTFKNEQLSAYWLTTDETARNFGAWYFATYDGHESAEGLSRPRYAWLVSPGLGQVATVPLPAAIWLLGPTLLGLLGLGRRNRDL